MNTLTLRQIPAQVEQRLRHLAHENHASLNKTTIDLLTKAVGLDTAAERPRKRRDIKGALLRWTQDDYAEFQRNTRQFEAIDPELWSK